MIRFELPIDKKACPVVLGLGVFDGVHQGHRKIIRELVEMGKRTGAVPVAVTFIPHPREILGAPPLPRLLLPPEERFRRLREAGAEAVGIIDFSRRIADTPPADFVEGLLTIEPPVRGVCVGLRWRFGREGKGDTRFLARELGRRGVDFAAVPELQLNGTVISSSGIRECIAAGDLAGAAEMLGTAPCLYGEVVPGCGVAGAKLHAPTANLRIEFGVLPPDGVYVGRVEVEGRRFAAVTNIGFSPTFGGTAERRVECHLIGFSGDLYRKRLAVEIAIKLRSERRFGSVEELGKQIRADRERAVELLSETLSN